MEFDPYGFERPDLRHEAVWVRWLFETDQPDPFLLVSQTAAKDLRRWYWLIAKPSEKPRKQG